MLLQSDWLFCLCELFFSFMFLLLVGITPMNSVISQNLVQAPRLQSSRMSTPSIPSELATNRWLSLLPLCYLNWLMVAWEPTTSANAIVLSLGVLLGIAQCCLGPWPSGLTVTMSHPCLLMMPGVETGLNNNTSTLPWHGMFCYADSFHDHCPVSSSGAREPS